MLDGLLGELQRSSNAELTPFYLISFAVMSLWHLIWLLHAIIFILPCLFTEGSHTYLKQ